MAVTDLYFERMLFMITVKLKSDKLYSGPGTSYAVNITGVNGKIATVEWKEGSYYYVSLTSLGVRGYVSEDDISFETAGRPRTVMPKLLKRYVSANGSAHLGPETTYRGCTSPEMGQAVYYLEEKVGDFAFIEYEVDVSSKKYRAWFPHMSLAIAPQSRLTRERYIENIETKVTPYNYEPEGSETFCNRYAFYAMKECNANLPTKSDGVTPGNCQEMYDKLITNQFSKWRMVDFAEAQHRANFGCPTIAISPNVPGYRGHVAVVRPNDGSTPNSKADVKITQAGSKVWVNVTLNWGWDTESAAYDAIRFFTWLY